MSDDEFSMIFANAGGPFADYLLALRETGARPKELRDLTWGPVQEDRWYWPSTRPPERWARPGSSS